MPSGSRPEQGNRGKVVACGRAGSRPGVSRAELAEKVIRADGSSSVGEDVFIVGHRIRVVAWLAGPRPCVRFRRGAGGGLRQRPTKTDLKTPFHRRSDVIVRHRPAPCAPCHCHIEPEIDLPRCNGENVPVQPLCPNVTIDPELETVMRGVAIETIQSVLVGDHDWERTEQ